jgi:uncharacterized repeat protein (TIGR03803 family)
MKYSENKQTSRNFPQSSRRPRVKLMMRTMLTCVVLTAVLSTALAKNSSAAVRVSTREAEVQSAPIDGRNPEAALIGDANGALYGTTINGGDLRCFKGCGTVFKLTPSGSRYQESIIYSFHGTPDGFNPAAGLITDSSGSLYGTTVNGGTNDWGSVFKLTPTEQGYVESTIYSFTGDPNGSHPLASLFEDKTGALYGTAEDYGPTIYGIVFKLTPSGGGYTFRVLHAFHFGWDGAYPGASLIGDGTGAIFGTTESGGAKADGNGTVFKLTPIGNGYNFNILYTFTGGSDGATPRAALLADAGSLYGTTENGGAAGKGTVFKLTPSGSGYIESVLHSFEGGADGHHPVAPLITDSTGSLYGTTEGVYNAQRFGTAFKLMPSGNGYDYSVLHLFEGGADGGIVDASLIEDDIGRLYGTTYVGGTVGLGTVYRLAPAAGGYRKTVLHNFQH